jgi:uncharacterized protein (UPF0179 family)
MPKKQYVTLIGKSYAHEGFKFYFKEPRNDICPKSCQFYNPCMMNLEPKLTYKVIKVTDIEHTCPSDYHEESMMLVNVEETDNLILIESKMTFLGATIIYEPFKCSDKNCSYKEYCAPIIGLEPGTKVKIMDVIQKIKDTKCGDKNISIVKVERI